MTNRFFAVDQTDAIHKSGTYAECVAFCKDPIAQEVAAAGGISFTVCSAEDWIRRTAPVPDPDKEDAS